MEKETIKNIDEILKENISLIMAKGKGILAADESNETAGKRLAEVGVPNSEENRRLYRELFLTAPEFEKYVSGVIFYDETFWQKSNNGETFRELISKKGIVPGIKIDLGAKDFPGFPHEKVTTGIDDLRERAVKYYEAGARFAKWRSITIIDEEMHLPTKTAVESNSELMAQYVKICHEVGLVPIVEPEVLLDGPHSIKTAEIVTTEVIKKLFEKIAEHKIDVSKLILKTSMVINGNRNADEASPQEVAESTVRMLLNSVPKEIGGVVFLSGGQTPVEATAHFDAIVEKNKLPFEIAFSYARALQGPALNIWKGDQNNWELAQKEFVKRLKLNSLADSGAYDIKLEYLD